MRRKKTGEFIVSKVNRARYLPKITEIASQISSRAAMDSDEYVKLSQTYYDDLFVDLKASWTRSVDGRNLLETQFVKTRSYFKIESQQAFFAVGRKGSGKSTLVQTLPLIQTNRYQAIVDIDVDKFNMETLFSLYSDRRFRSDTSNAVSRQEAFELTWEAVLMLALINEIANLEHTPSQYLRSDSKALIPIKNFIHNLKGEDIEKKTSSKHDVFDQENLEDWSYRELHKVLVENFDEQELKTICFYLDVDFENLSGEGKTNKARELIQHIDRVNLIPDLKKEILKQRPHILGSGDSKVASSSKKELIEWRTVDFFNFCFYAMVRFVRDCIDGARDDPEVFYADISIRFTRDRFLEFVFGREVCDSLWAILRRIDRKFLITFDGFDTAFDEFRVGSIRDNDEVGLRRRTNFEIDWLRSLLHLTIKAKSTKDNYLYSVLDFCVVAPMDRFMEVVRIERDSYRNWNRWFSIQWSGIELSILLRKRLEGIANFHTNKEESPQRRLNEILGHSQFRHIPSHVSFEFNGRSYTLPLFMYVLRHTFWRPREVLLYYAKILALADNMQKWGNQVTGEALRNCIKSTTKSVIEEQFISELRSSVINIEDIIGVFRRCKSQLDYQSIRNLVNMRIFKFATEDLSERDVVSKVRFLYEIGFLGMHLTKEQQINLGVWYEYAFQFNEGLSIFEHRFLEEDDLENITFVIHPIFSEYLRLDTSENSLSLCFDWDYLRRQEAALIARQGM